MTSYDHETTSSYYQGLREGFDPEVAEDLGIPMSPETVDSHIESAQKVRDALVLAATDGAAEHARIVEAEGPVICANCNTPGCPGCGKS